jgi:hypothetical protein
VQREPEWNDSSRGRALRLGEHETSLCPCGCGQTIEVSRNPEALFVVHEDVDYARVALEKVRDQKRQAAKGTPKENTWDDGLTLWVEHVTSERAEQMQQGDTPTLARRRVTGGN